MDVFMMKKPAIKAILLLVALIDLHFLAASSVAADKMLTPREFLSQFRAAFDAKDTEKMSALAFQRRDLLRQRIDELLADFSAINGTDGDRKRREALSLAAAFAQCAQTLSEDGFPSQRIKQYGLWSGSERAIKKTADLELQAARNAYNEGGFEEVVSRAGAAVDRYRSLADVAGEEDALHYWGQAERKRANYAKSLELHARALALAEENHDRAGQGQALIDEGDVYERRKDHAMAVECYTRSLAIIKIPAEWREAARAYLQLGDIQVASAEFDNAYKSYSQAVKYAEEFDDPPQMAAAYAYLGYFYRRIGNLTSAIEVFDRSLQAAGRIGRKEDRARAEARALNHLGICYTKKAEARSIDKDIKNAGPLFREAIDLESRALAAAKTGKDFVRQGYILRELARIHREFGEGLTGDDAARQYRYALDCAGKALEHALGMKEKEWEGLALHEKGLALASLGRYAEALETLNASLALWEAIGDIHSAAMAYESIGRDLYERQRNFAGALASYNSALELFHRLHAAENIATELFLVSRLFETQGNRDAAIVFGKQAVNTIQSIRSNLLSLDENTRKAFLQTKESVYRRLADMLIEQGRLPEAQQVLSMLKEEEYFDFVRRDTKQTSSLTVTVSYTSKEEQWTKRYRTIGTQLAGLGKEHQTLKDKIKKQEPLSEEEQKRFARIDEDLKVATKVFNNYLTELLAGLKDVSTLRAMEIGEKNLAKLKAMQGTLKELGNGAVFLHYLVTSDKVRIILTTPSVQLARESGIDEKELNKKIAAYRETIQRPGKKGYKKQARDLYDILIGPVAEDLKQAEAQTLMLSLDGTLRYLPYAALYDGEKYLIENYRLAIFTEAAKDKIKDLPAGDWSVAGFGVSKQVSVDFVALPSVKQELQGISDTLPTEVYIDEAFTNKQFKQTLLEQRPVVHIASHFRFMPGKDMESYLLLGDGGKLTLEQVKDGEYEFTGVDLLTLSACETAIGGSGREIEGFGAMAQLHGAKTVLATLWPVADESTGQFMQVLYRERQRGKLSKAEAMQHVQTQFIADAAYSHPYYWAPFILMGNWR